MQELERVDNEMPDIDQRQVPTRLSRATELPPGYKFQEQIELEAVAPHKTIQVPEWKATVQCKVARVKMEKSVKKTEDAFDIPDIPEEYRRLIESTVDNLTLAKEADGSYVINVARPAGTTVERVGLSRVHGKLAFVEEAVDVTGIPVKLVKYQDQKSNNGGCVFMAGKRPIEVHGKRDEAVIAARGGSLNRDVILDGSPSLVRLPLIDEIVDTPTSRGNPNGSTYYLVLQIDRDISQYIAPPKIK